MRGESRASPRPPIKNVYPLRKKAPSPTITGPKFYKIKKIKNFKWLCTFIYLLFFYRNDAKDTINFTMGLQANMSPIIKEKQFIN